VEGKQTSPVVILIKSIANLQRFIYSNSVVILVLKDNIISSDINIS